MSLRTRLVLWLGCVLAVTLGLGCALAGWHAVASVRTEMQSALETGQHAVANSIDEIAGSASAPNDLRHLVATFDGNRHVRASYSDTQGAVIASSIIQAPARPIPEWFRRSIGPALVPVVLPAASGAITLAADPTNEVGEVWDQANDAVRTLAVFFALTVLLLYWTIGRALSPLARLSMAFEQIGAGDYTTRLDRTGPPELARLATGFNRMAEQLGRAEQQNRQLGEQLLTLQEEERADLARDLHDEIGPFLFAAGIDVAGIPALLQDGRSGDVIERAVAAGESIAHVQSHIRSILGRLRPLSFGAVSLPDAITNIVTFWRGRHPGITFALELAGEEDPLNETVRAIAGRVVQESIYNAVRHGHPARIDIGVSREGDDLVVRVDDDGAGPGEAGLTPGFGLIGMRERVQARAGTLVIAAGKHGLSVTARLPLGTGV